MDIQAYRDEIRLKLTGRLLDLELDDSTLDSVINSAFREIQRYIDTTRLATIQYSPCIDLSKCGVNAVVAVYRSQGYLSPSADASDGISGIDPMYAMQWQILAGLGTGMFNNYALSNYAAWNTSLQIKNTISTDLAFKYDRHSDKLYINCAFDQPQYITIEYVPRYNDVSEIVSDYWIDMIIRLAVALTKTILGRIRSRFTQSNALWTQDGETLLAEGNEELTTLREYLAANTALMYPID